MILKLATSLLLLLGSGVPRSQSILEPGGTLLAVDGITIVANTAEFEAAQSIVVERVELEDLPVELPGSENRIAPFYRFSSDTEWFATYDGLEVHVPLPEGVDVEGLAWQAFTPRGEFLHDLPEGIPGLWFAVPATYDAVAHAAVFKLRVLEPRGFYITFSSGNFPSSKMH